MGLNSTLSLVTLVSSYFMFQIVIDLRDISYDYLSLKRDYVLCVQHYNVNGDHDINLLETSHCSRIDRTLYSYIVDYSSEPAATYTIDDATNLNSFQQYIPINIDIYLFKNVGNLIDVSTYSLLGMDSMMLVEHKSYNVTCLRNVDVSESAGKGIEEIYLDLLYEYVRSYYPTSIQSSVLHVAALNHTRDTDINYVSKIRNMLLAHSKYIQIILPHEYRHLCNAVLSYSVICHNIESNFKYDYASSNIFISIINDEKLFTEISSKQVESVMNKQYYGNNTVESTVLLLVATSIAGSVKRIVQDMNLQYDIRHEGGEYILMHLHRKDINDRAVRNEELPSSYTSKLEFDFNYGINQAHLSRVCLVNRTSIAYFNTEIPAHLRDILSRSSSGFYSPEGSSGYNFVRWQHYMANRIQFVDETVAIMTPVFNNNIYHAAQTYMALVYAVQNNLSYVETLSTVIVPNVHSKHEVNYCIELLRVIVTYVESKRRNKKAIAVLFQEDISFDSETVYCFQDLHLLGSLELALPLVSSAEHAVDFRNYVYKVTNSVADTTEELSPNDPLRVTIVARSSNRHIMNLNRAISMLLKTGLCDVTWLKHNSFVQLETLSFEEQVSLMHQTDILITAHGAQLTNLMFLSPGSAVIEIMTAPWYEYGYIGTAIMFSINFATVAMETANIHHLFDCQFNRECIHGERFPLQINRRDLDCYSMRLCNANISVDSLEVLFIQASQYVRIYKRNLTKYRQPAVSGSHSRFYRKSYVDALDRRNFITE